MTDKYNPDPAQRGRPLVGVPVLYGLVPDGPGRLSGRLYNVDNGNSYAACAFYLDQTLKNRILLENYYLPGDLEVQIARFVEHYDQDREAC